VNALTLSRAYFEAVALPSLRARFPELLPSLAAGLVGNGSECFGFDDEISRDHDWGVDFFVWVPESLRAQLPNLAAWKQDLLAARPPDFPRTRSEYGARVGVETVGDFYKSLVGAPEGPQTLAEWIAAPEENLAMSVNGAVFLDNAGEFTRIRARLLGFMPEDLRMKRLSYRCMTLAQAGQYNFDRSLRRGDLVAARAALSRFTDAAIETVFLLNRRYCPYYKWRFRAMLELGAPASALADDLRLLADAKLSTEPDAARAAIERVCKILAQTLRQAGLCASDGDFLTTQGEELRARITTPALRDLPAQYSI
jgi:hypothetical protein